MTSKRILAVASKGEHWQQMSVLSAAFVGHRVCYVSTADGLADYTVPDCSRSEWWLAFVTGAQLCKIIWIERPEVIISTGALPGLLAVVLGRVAGGRTIWMDSIANTENLSLSGRLCRPFAGLWLTQWPDVAERSGATYAGSVG